MSCLFLEASISANAPVYPACSRCQLGACLAACRLLCLLGGRGGLLGTFVCRFYHCIDIFRVCLNVAGIYGRAYNNGTAPAYGGFFYNLFAGGLTLGRKCISSTTTVYLSSTKSLVVGYTSAQVLVYLPTDAKEGTVILFKQWWTGYMRIYPRSGQKLYDDSTQNDYYDVGEGEMLIAQFTIGYITSGSTTTKVEAWLVNKFKY